MKPHDAHPPFRQEPDDPPHRLVLVVMLAAAVIAAVLGAWGWITGSEGTVALRPSRALPERGIRGPRPAGIHQELFGVAPAGQALHRQKLERLSSYGWIDRDAGVAHIPIEDAIEALAEDGPR